MMMLVLCADWIVKSAAVVGSFAYRRIQSLRVSRNSKILLTIDRVWVGPVKSFMPTLYMKINDILSSEVEL